MKNVILYYYNLTNINITPYKGKNLVKSNGNIFLFERINNLDEVKEQYELTKTLKDYYDFVVNRENSIFTKYKDNYYVLLKVKKNDNNYLDKIINPVEVETKDEIKSWPELWMKKCDFIEYQMNHIINKYKVIDESIDYYIGLIEVAIEYLSYNEKTKDTRKFIVHKRIDKRNFYNPLNIKVGFKERDLAGYLKYLFLENIYTEEDILKIINKANLNYDEAIRLFSRMLFPSHYLDIYDRVIMNEISENELKKIVLRTDEYEFYLKMIFKILNKKNDMPYIHFL